MVRLALKKKGYQHAWCWKSRNFKTRPLLRNVSASYSDHP